MFRARRAPADRGVTDADVVYLYQTVLGRVPSADEVARQRAAAADWRELLAAMLASEEFRMFRAKGFEPGSVAYSVNMWHPDLARWTYPIGTYSPDGDAVVGRDGHLFLVGGTNSVVAQYQPGLELPEGWLGGWASAVDERRAGASALGAELVTLVVPDKLSALRDQVPDTVPLPSSPPAATLAAQLDLLYPVAELAEVAGGAFLRTDTHLNLQGNAALGSVVLAALGEGSTIAVGDTSHALEYLSSGDLGARFTPKLVEVMRGYQSWGAADLVDDNWPAVQGKGRHVGARRVLRNDDSPDGGKVVVFGDSYALPEPHYQGVAWILAQRFREVHFVWSPFGWDPDYVRRVGAAVVVCETAERFVPRIPDTRIDVDELAREAVGAE